MFGINPNEIIEAVSNIVVDTSSIQGQVTDEDIFNFYCNRLQMCLADGCPNAAQAYLEKMNQDKSINASTKLEIVYFYSKLK